MLMASNAVKMTAIKTLLIKVISNLNEKRKKKKSNNHLAAIKSLIAFLLLFCSFIDGRRSSLR